MKVKVDRTFLIELDIIIGIQRALQLANKAKYAHVNADYKATSLKSKQSDCLKLAAAKNDIIACLPTGYGKSLIYEVLPYIEVVFRKDADSAILIVTPLNAIIDDHLQRIGERGFKIEINADCMAKFSDKMHKYFFGHPESILDERIHNIWLSQASRVKWIVVDEAHCIKKWAIFRPLYNQLDRLRALFPNAKVLALTATATTLSREEMRTKLAMHVI